QGDHEVLAADHGTLLLWPSGYVSPGRAPRSYARPARKPHDRLCPSSPGFDRHEDRGVKSPLRRPVADRGATGPPLAGPPRTRLTPPRPDPPPRGALTVLLAAGIAVALLAGGPLASRPSAEAAPKIPRIGTLDYGAPDPARLAWWTAFR